METEKKCDNCKFYVKHYVKSGGRFYAVRFGHCAEDLRKRDLRTCGKWESKTEAVAEKVKSVEKTLDSISKSLSHIVSVLTDTYKKP